MDRLRDDGACRYVGSVVRKDKRAELILSTYFRINVGGVTDCFLDLGSLN